MPVFLSAEVHTRVSRKEGNDGGEKGKVVPFVSPFQLPGAPRPRHQPPNRAQRPAPHLMPQIPTPHRARQRRAGALLSEVAALAVAAAAPPLPMAFFPPRASIVEVRVPWVTAVAAAGNAPLGGGGGGGVVDGGGAVGGVGWGVARLGELEGGLGSVVGGAVGVLVRGGVVGWAVGVGHFWGLGLVWGFGGRGRWRWWQVVGPSRLEVGSRM